ncbi:Hypothetical protein ORPV_50 [Orpheovirus IHUMI-LCC2]|uniref:Uncharacterized protein n=1 Tax=Orpheovirus IHUMI-LCC2 TaxID=2023057 RepID=A0A2I2L347_9VIRU|nr:Hypothetical protein ORPV_50 [Orpheovirus IHUMI-LCC2]SNW61954.1 Hypothetical protein ORPV_50 [Orpheovirus IHUMI-LCC2]
MIYNYHIILIYDSIMNNIITYTNTSYSGFTSSIDTNDTTLNISKNSNKVTSQWNIETFNTINTPDIIHQFRDNIHMQSFSKQNGIRVLDIPIYMPNGEGWKIPNELSQFINIISLAVSHEDNIKGKNWRRNTYVYMTVDQQGPVLPGTKQRRDGLHTDSFIKKISTGDPDSLYIMVDSCPTPWYPGPFNLSNNLSSLLVRGKNDILDGQKVFTLFADIVERDNMKPIYYPSYALLHVTPYDVHNVGINDGNVPVYRTFFRLCFSKNKFGHAGNTINPFFSYDNWIWTPRKGIYYNRKELGRMDLRKDADKFKIINPSMEIDWNNMMQQDIQWTDGLIHKGDKKDIVNIVKMRKEDVGKTFVTIHHDENGDEIKTMNVIEDGNYEVTTDDGDKFIINNEQFKMYDRIEGSRYKIEACDRLLMKVTQYVRFKTLWGCYDYCYPGDYIVYNNKIKNDIYCVPKNIVDRTYTLH